MGTDRLFSEAFFPIQELASNCSLVQNLQCVHTIDRYWLDFESSEIIG